MALELPDGESGRELIKCVVVGDSGVGKTKLICAQALGQCVQPEPRRKHVHCIHGSHVPSVFAIDRYYKSVEIQARSNMVVDGVPVALRLWDTFGDHNNNRKFAYQHSHVVALCFAVNWPMSLESVNRFWYNEIKNYCPKTPIVLVGTKADHRASQSPAEEMPKQGGNLSRRIRECKTVTPMMGRQIAQEIGAHYYECSSLTMCGLQDVFQNTIRSALCNERAKRLLSKQLRKVLMPQLQVPQLPPCPKMPEIVVPQSSYYKDFAALLDTQLYYDVIIVMHEKKFKLHKAILCAAGCEIHELPCRECGIDSEQEQDAQTLVLTDSTLSINSFNNLFCYLYSGSLPDNTSISELTEFVECLNASEFASKSSLCFDKDCNIFASWKRNIATNMWKLVFQKQLVPPDVWFELEETIIPAHKAVVVARCPMMAAMFQDGHFKEANRQNVNLPDMNLKAFLAVLEYIYTDEVNQSYQGSKVAVLAVANFFCLPRLVALCEKLIVKELQSEILNLNNVVEYLLVAEMHNATQLKAWGEHCIIINYDKINTTALNALPAKTSRSLASRRWPPVWYLLENDWYEKAARKQSVMSPKKYK